MRPLLPANLPNRLCFYISIQHFPKQDTDGVNVFLVNTDS